MNGPVSVNLPHAVSVHIGNPVWANEERCVHREHDDTDGPTVDRDNFRREIVGRPTHCLFRKEGDCACQRSSGDQCEQTTQTRERTLSIVRLSTTGEAKVRNFDDRWIVFRQKHVLGNQIGVRGVKGEHRTETANLGFEIAKCDALGVDVLQARDFRVGRAHSVESGMGRTEREEHI